MSYFFLISPTEEQNLQTSFSKQDKELLTNQLTNNEERFLETGMIVQNAKILKQNRLLKETTRDLQSKLEFFLAELSERPPIWVPDEERVQCFTCNTKFTIFNRRHHCRSCGEIFCGTCSKFSKSLPAYPRSGPQRVCESCFRGRQQFDPDLLDTSAVILSGIGFGASNPKPMKELTDLSENFDVSQLPSAFISGQSLETQNKRNINSTCQSAFIEQQRQFGKVRSDIPIAPPLPDLTNLNSKRSGSQSAVVTFNTICKNPSHGPSKKKLNTKNNQRKIDLEEIKLGISRLKKIQDTPKVTTEIKDEPLSAFKRSLQKRRQALEDSPSNQENIPVECNVPMFDQLRRTLVFQEQNVNNSFNASFTKW